MKFKENDAAILVVFGQSNAHGHGTHLPQERELNVGLKNVYGLACDKNQHYGLQDVCWSNFVTHSMNLGETQDNTYCLAEEFARKWQCEIDSDNLYSLPNLYVVQISIGAMGIDEHERDGLNMWWKNRPLVMSPNTLDSVNISLYPLAVEILHLAVLNLQNAGKTPKIVGLHWNQWETEVDTGGEVLARARANYRELFTGFRAAAQIDFPLYLYRPISEVYNNPQGVVEIDELFKDFASKDERVRIMDLTVSALFDANRADKGIFQTDLVHYSPASHKWFADKQFNDMLLCE